jgi:GT2 family glycosyltransferase
VKTAPIALFAYNRPAHLRRALEALCTNAEIGSSTLVIFSDGAKHPKDAQAVVEVRQIARGVTGCARVELIEREGNLGLARSIVEGVSSLCRQHGEVIVLEDDLVVSPHFLKYMNAALQRYTDESRVMQIAGYMFPAELDIEDDALFLPLTSSWGWATWQRAWASFDSEIRDWSRISADARLLKAFDLDGAYDYSGMVEAQRRGAIDSWAIRWYVSVFAKNGLVLFPRRTLVENGGFDASGIHGRAPAAVAAARIDPRFEVRAFPNDAVPSPAFQQVKRGLISPSRVTRWWNAIAARPSR